MDFDATVIAVFSAAAGAALSLMAACSRYFKHIALVLIVATVLAAPVRAQVAGKEPGWFLKDAKENKPDPKPTPKAKVIRKTVVIVRKPAAAHHIMPHRHKPHHRHWHRCKFLFLRWWCKR